MMIMTQSELVPTNRDYRPLLHRLFATSLPRPPSKNHPISTTTKPLRFFIHSLEARLHQDRCCALHPTSIAASYLPPFSSRVRKHSLIPPTRQTHDPALHLQSQPAFPSIHRSILWISIDLLSITFLPLLLILTIRLSISFSLSKTQHQDVWSTR